MSSHPTEHARRTSGRELTALLGAAGLVGLGITLMTGWIVTNDWAWFGIGIAACLGGGLLLFTPWTGPERA